MSDFKRLQSQSNGIENNTNVKHPLAQIRKIKNTTAIRTLAIDETALLTNAMVNRKKLDVSIRKVSYITG